MLPSMVAIPIQWAKNVFSQPPIVQVLPLKKVREACKLFSSHVHFNYDIQNEKEKSRKSHCRIFNEFICKLWWKISIWSPTKKQDFWLSQTCNFFKRLLCSPLVTCINGTCLNLLSVYKTPVHNLKQSHSKLHYGQDQRAVKGHQKQNCRPAPGWED